MVRISRSDVMAYLKDGSLVGAQVPDECQTWGGLGGPDSDRHLGLAGPGFCLVSGVTPITVGHSRQAKSPSST